MKAFIYLKIKKINANKRFGKKGVLQNLKKVCNTLNFYCLTKTRYGSLFCHVQGLILTKKIYCNIFIINKLELLLLYNKSNSGESFWKMGGGEKNLFSKRFFPHRTVLQQPLFPLLKICRFIFLSRWRLFLRGVLCRWFPEWSFRGFVFYRDQALIRAIVPAPAE